MHPSIRRAFEQGTHPLAKHPILGKHGQKLAMAQYENLKDRYEKTGGRPMPQAMMQMMQVLRQIMIIEAPYKEQLEQLAVQVVKEVWGIEDELNFNADMISDPSEFQLSDYEPEETEEDEELSAEERKQVQKRITLNSMTHGAALHQMTTMHHLVANALKKIDPRLSKLYDLISSGSQLSSWFADIEMILGMMGQQGGEVNVEWPGEDEGQEQEDAGNITVNARAIVFPMLVHELSKGVMEVLTAHGLPKDPSTLKKVYREADRPEHEVFHFFVGPEIWRKFIKAVGKRRLPDVISTLSVLEPDEIHKVIGVIIDNPEDADEMLDEMMEDIEEEGEIDWDDMWQEFGMEEFIVTKDCDVILDGEQYRLQTGDKIMMESFNNDCLIQCAIYREAPISKPTYDSIEDWEDKFSGKESPANVEHAKQILSTKPTMFSGYVEEDGGVYLVVISDRLCRKLERDGYLNIDLGDGWKFEAEMP